MACPRLKLFCFKVETINKWKEKDTVSRERKEKKVGLIGAGGFGLHHFQMLLEAGPAHGMRLVAVADPTSLPAATNEAMETHALQLYPDYEKMFAEENLDGVFIATPVPMHFAMTSSALRQGLSVYLEKPPVTSVRQLDELIRMDAHQRVQVGFHMMSWPGIRGILHRIRSGTFGEVHSLRVLALWPRNTAYYQRASWAGKMGSAENPIFDGPATNAMSHYVQLLCAGAAAAGGRALSEVRGEFYRARPIESYDTCSLAGKFDGGPSCSVVMSHSAGPGAVTRLTMETERGTFTFDDADFARAGRNRYQHSLGFAHRDFGLFLHQEVERPRVTLANCRTFIELVTCGLSDSGGISSIPEEFISRLHTGDEELFVVQDLQDLARRCAENGQTFSEAAPPWSLKLPPAP